MPGRYYVTSTRDSRYARGTTYQVRRQGIHVRAGRPATSPRVVVKDQSHIRAKATWHARTLTLRIRVTSGATGRAVAGEIRAVVLHGGERRHVRLHHGRAVVTIAAGRAARAGGWATYSVRYHASRHVAPSIRRWDHDF